MGLSPQLITDDLYKKAVKQLEQMSKDNRAAIRLRAIVAAKEHGVNRVSAIFGITSNTLRLWVKNFQSGGLAQLDYKKGRGRKSNLLQIHRDAILMWLKDDCNLTINQLLQKLEQKFELKSSKSALHRVLKTLKLSYITPRPQHYKQDKEKQEEFKKKSERSVKRKPR